MSDLKLPATVRTEFGKGAARRLRRAHLIPAVLYGHGEKPQHITLPGHETMLALKHHNALITLDVEGTEELAIAKDVQRDPVRQEIEHVDLLLVRRGEKVTVEVTVHVVGESAPGTIHMVDAQSITLEAEATHLPEVIEVSVEGLEAGTQVRGADLVMPEGAVFAGDPEATIVTIAIPRAEVEEPVEGAEGVEGVELPEAEGEGEEPADEA
ncbi:50S ribosomal protein L25/general stress protein Ctc [Isoptericola sp. b441]|uniref:Large ribosomal subunit protein bL25 n=1 Tax=Actinotalea lenta TaxID=3064654 RepID=A0ABT9D960_9CELL|nr:MULTISPECIES: 50S ribosomal protein L25/general stress protein Ctc [unclassified Isoptericola]MDO8106794.1 50S ribosomal protein L25/general stress protein Ctc [Isoptericola sp. b441]MDO8121495.1 50S ribosomal protein L25/general stress protein Ctc [Isoptericola sp. b490]